MTNESEQPTNEIEINLGDVVRFLRSNFKKIVGWGLGFGLLGAVYAFTAQKEFESKVVLLPELVSSSSLGKMGGLGALAGLAGIDLSQMGSTEAIRPDLYPNVLQSLPFALYLLDQQVYVSEWKKQMPLKEYFAKKNEGWLGQWLGDEESSKSTLIDPQNVSKTVQLDKKQEAQIKDLQKRVVASIDRKSGTITVSTKMPDPVVAATTARLAIEYLQEYVTNYRTEKVRKQLIFLTQQTAEAKVRYQRAEANLASYRDRNRFLTMQMAKIEEQRLQADYLTAQTVHNDLLRQLEQMKIKVEEETPVLKVLEPARIPLKKSEPKRMVIVFMFGSIGVCLSLLTTILRHKQLKKLVNY